MISEMTMPVLWLEGPSLSAASVPIVPDQARIALTAHELSHRVMYGELRVFCFIKFEVLQIDLLSLFCVLGRTRIEMSHCCAFE
jgi:hypothetical protein